MDAQSVAGIIAHMNEDHADAVVLYARHFAGVDATDAVLVGFDELGLEIDCGTGEDRRRVRVDFAEPVSTPGQARNVLIEMAKIARAGAK
ncbi:MAG: DUF2470 domain-containing protein [Gammaproteobacteria bacterium]|nr:DUF2470 domain-containing protein [Gammaproteobacteria bacterium]